MLPSPHKPPVAVRVVHDVLGAVGVAALMLAAALLYWRLTHG